MAQIDIVNIKALCREGKLRVYVVGNAIYLKDAGSGEAVRIGDAPTIRPVRGAHWNGWTTSAYMGLDEDKEPKWAERKFYRCSECRKGSAVRHKFCPSCGAKMDGDAHD